MNVFEDVEAIISAWTANYKTMNGAQILDAESKLSGYSYYLADIAADIKRDYLISYFNRKVAVNNAKLNGIREGRGVGESEAIAIEATKIERETEIRREGEAYKADLLLRQVNRVLDAMRQRVSWIKKEMETTKTQ